MINYTPRLDAALKRAAYDKIHNLLSTLADYDVVGDELWQRFTTKNATDQVWWYSEVLQALDRRNAPAALLDRLGELVDELRQKVPTKA